MFIIPPQDSKKHTQDNKSDFSGTIIQSRNINLDEQGYIKLAETPVAQFTTDDDASFNNADASLASSSSIYINSTEEFSGVADFGSLSNRTGDTNKPTPAVEEDVTYFNGTEVVSDGSSIYYRSGASAWTTVSVSGAPFSTSFPTCLNVYGASLAVGNNNCVKFINTSWVVNTTVLTLPNEYQVTSMVTIGNSLYIATRSKYGGTAKLFTINAIKTSHDYSYPVGTFELFSIKPFKSTFVGLDSIGRLLKFNGGGFDTLAVLPSYQTNTEWADALNDYSKLSNRGLICDGDLIYVAVESEMSGQNSSMMPNFLSGVWCYDDSNGAFYHRYANSYSRIKTISGLVVTVNTTNNDFTLTSGNLNDVITGMPVLYDDGNLSGISGLVSGRKSYFIIKDSSTVFRLAESYADAVAGTVVDITSTGTTSQQFFVIKTNDYGLCFNVDRQTAIVLNTNLFEGKFCGRLAFTGTAFGKQSLTNNTVFTVISPYLPNRGYFVTTKRNSRSVEDNYSKLTLKFRPLDVDDKIIIKYRKEDKLGLPFSSPSEIKSSTDYATWSDTDTFTTTVDLSDASVGDEIEIVSGVGSGHIAHISEISESSGTYTVTLSEAFPFAVANDIFYFIVNNWIYWDTIDNTNTLGYYEKTVGTNGKFIQFKIELRGIGTTIEELQVDNSEHKSARG